MTFDIFEVLTRAAKITWKYKILWIFGMLASCGRRSGGNSNSSSSGNGSGGNNPISSQMMRQAEAFFERMADWYTQNTWIVFAAIAVFLVIIALQIFSAITGTAGLGRGVVHAEAGIETLHFGELFTESLNYFWRLFGVGVIIWLPYAIFFILIVFGSILYMVSNNFNELAAMSGFVLMIASLCFCAIPISIALTLYHYHVKRAVIIEDMSVTESLGRGWHVLIKNIIPMLIIGVLLFILSLIIGVIVALPIFIILIPLIITFVQGNITSWSPFIWAAVALLCYGPIAWFFRGVLTTYTESAWTLAYMRAIQPKDEPEDNTPILETNSNA